MGRYVLENEYTELPIDAKDAETARKLAVVELSNLESDSGTLTGPNGQVWILIYEGFLMGMSGWTYHTDSDPTPKKVYRSFPHPRNALADEDWVGVYELADGTFLVADVSENYNDEDFSVLGAIYYNIYDSEGEVDGGWFGYDEFGTWQDFEKSIGSIKNRRIVRCLWKGSQEGFFQIVDMLEGGASPEEVYEVCGVSPMSASKKKPNGPKSRNVKAPASKHGKGKAPATRLSRSISKKGRKG